MNSQEIKMIPLQCGGFAIVDEGDYDELMKYKWKRHKKREDNVSYANHTERKADNFPGFDSLHPRSILMHRYIMGLFPGDKKIQVDHIDSNGLNNCRANLRLATNGQNMGNRRKSKGKAPGSSKYKGVFRKRGVWTASIRQIYLGGYPTEEEAALAYNQAATKYFGEFARLNVITYDPVIAPNSPS